MSSVKEKRMRRQVRRSYIISTVSIALVLFMLGTVSYVTLSAISAASLLRDSVVVSVEVAPDTEEGLQAGVRRVIEGSHMVESIEFLGRDAKLEDEEFRRQFDVDLDLLLGENPLYDSFEVRLKGEHSNAEDVEAFVALVSEVEGVEHVATPPVDIVESMHRTITHATVALLIFLGVLLVISMLLLNNTIRLAIYAKRYLINTMKLVGATKWYIMRPLLVDAFKQGVVAGIVASVMMCGIVYGADSFTPDGIVMLDIKEVSAIVGSIVALGIVITVCFSAFAVNKFVNMKSNKIHLY
ncbi:MAG: permease-like cell division protein FtsX [Alistipes sp.]|nr:permease-like cell division protein FtsX [Alistipes sp.]